MLTIVPVVIMPLFNTYSPLEVFFGVGLRRATIESYDKSGGVGIILPEIRRVKWEGGAGRVCPC